MPTPPETAAPAAAPARSSSPATSAAGSCLVQTTIGPIEGFVDPAYPGVRQWLGVPFAEPPVGARRFLPPEPKKALPGGGVYSATRMPPAPMQAYTTKPDVYAKYVPEFLAPGPYSEDCLYLNVFAPTLRSGKTGKGHEDGKDEDDGGPLPTLVFFYGGEGEWGGVNAEYSQPQAWVQRSQKHLVVLFKWVASMEPLPCSVAAFCGVHANA
jgi:carboxylesterase type B